MHKSVHNEIEVPVFSNNEAYALKTMNSSDWKRGKDDQHLCYTVFFFFLWLRFYFHTWWLDLLFHNKHLKQKMLILFPSLPHVTVADVARTITKRNLYLCSRSSLSSECPKPSENTEIHREDSLLQGSVAELKCTVAAAGFRNYFMFWTCLLLEFHSSMP